MRIYSSTPPANTGMEPVVVATLSLPADDDVAALKGPIVFHFDQNIQARRWGNAPWTSTPNRGRQAGGERSRSPLFPCLFVVFAVEQNRSESHPWAWTVEYWKRITQRIGGIICRARLLLSPCKSRFTRKLGRAHMSTLQTLRTLGDRRRTTTKKYIHRLITTAIQISCIMDPHFKLTLILTDLR